jgi:hypothetical protein
VGLVSKWNDPEWHGQLLMGVGRRHRRIDRIKIKDVISVFVVSSTKVS